MCSTDGSGTRKLATSQVAAGSSRVTPSDPSVHTPSSVHGEAFHRRNVATVCGQPPTTASSWTFMTCASAGRGSVSSGRVGLRVRMATKTNPEIAAAFDELGDLYELDGAVSYRVIAYRTAAKAVRDASVSIMALTREGNVTSLPGIGKTLEEKLLALDQTGDIPAAVKLRAKFPTGLIAVMHLPGFGPKRARLLHDELGIDSLESLRAAAEKGEIRNLRGFGAKVEENLLRILAEHEDGGGPAPRILLSRALPVAEQIAGALRDHPAADRVEIAGSLRRMADSAKDIDIIATASDVSALVSTLSELELVESVRQSGDA